MKGRADIPLILGMLRPSKRLTSTQDLVLSQCAAMPEGTINFIEVPMGGAPKQIKNILNYREMRLEVCFYNSLKHQNYQYEVGLQLLFSSENECDRHTFLAIKLQMNHLHISTQAD